MELYTLGLDNLFKNHRLIAWFIKISQKDRVKDLSNLNQIIHDTP